MKLKAIEINTSSIRKITSFFQDVFDAEVETITNEKVSLQLNGISFIFSESIENSAQELPFKLLIESEDRKNFDDLQLKSKFYYYRQEAIELAEIEVLKWSEKSQYFQIKDPDGRPWFILSPETPAH